MCDPTDWVRNKINFLVGPQERFLWTHKEVEYPLSCQLSREGNLLGLGMTHHDTLSKSNL